MYSLLPSLNFVALLWVVLWVFLSQAHCIGFSVLWMWRSGLQHILCFS